MFAVVVGETPWFAVECCKNVGGVAAADFVFALEAFASRRADVADVALIVVLVAERV